MEEAERPAKIRKIEQDSENVSDVGSQESDTQIITENVKVNEDVLNDHPEAQPGESNLVKADGAAPSEGITKSRLKKIRRQEAWAAGKADRKLRKKEKEAAKKKLKREQKAQADAERKAKGIESEGEQQRRPPPVQPISVPLTFLIDCDFDEQMLPKETVSLSAQVTRCYSENRKAQFRPEMAVSSFSGRMKTRFENELRSLHERWSHVHVETEDFVEVAEKAKQWMIEEGGEGLTKCPAFKDKQNISPGDGEIVYLTADSEDTLHELKPYSTYIIGGIVDRNRHKGICYKRASNKNIRTAKLPIGEFLEMSSRSVLATNHVYEIMLSWLELNDWGEAFMKVIPKRKGGVLRSNAIADRESDGVNHDQDAD